VSTLLVFGSLWSLFIRDLNKRQRKISNLVKILSKNLMAKLGFKIKVEGLEHLKKDQNYLIIANHVSYIDVTLIYSFINNNRFITHNEWRERSPFLHIISKKSGVYFIERRNFKNIRRELKDATHILKSGLHLIFFPEGTSTSGSSILPFHPAFFSAAILAKKSILPTYIHYTKVGKELVSEENKDLIYWYDQKVSFKDHVLRLFQIKSIEVHLKFLPPISSEGKNSRTLAEESRNKLIDAKKEYTSYTIANP